MASKTTELQDILSTLDTLQSRVRELTGDQATPPETAGPAADAASEVGADFPAPPRALGSAAGSAPSAAAIPPDMMSLLRAGVSELNTMSRLKEFPEYFSRLASRTGLRMLLLKRWTSGLQVFLEQNIKMPAEAKSKRSDGRAPIPCTRQDIFAAVAQDGTVYSGPVPVRHFPLDLTLMLGRGSRDRQIIIMPLPAQNHWNTFLYLDADKATEKVLAVAEILAHFALARMCLLNKGVNLRHGQVSGILRSELHRRQQHQAKRAAAPEERQDADDGADGLEFVHSAERAKRAEPSSGPEAPAGSQPDEIDPFKAVQPPAGAGEDRGEAPKPERRLRSRRAAPSAADLPETPEWDDGSGRRRKLAPEEVLQHSGELPALPKAACHIMAVIEDPRTTATKLEKALAMDQALTAKVLRIANSPFYGAVREISTVSEAIVRLGFVTIRNWTLVTAARSVFLAPGAGMLYQKIWRQSVMSAMSGQLVAQAVGRAQPESVFIGGLMQNIGQLVLARSHPELFQEILGDSSESGRPYHEVERETLGFDHGELGALLLKEWNLSEDLEEAVRWHHRFDDAEARNARVAAMIALGEEVAHCHSGDEGATPPVVMPEQDGDEPYISDAAKFLGLTPGRVAELVQQAGELKIDPHFFN